VVKLATKGRSRWQKAHAAYASALQEFEAALSATERATVQRALEKILRKCDERLD
jgi:DNA-binding MarR family transcriptional regulator